MSLPTHMIAILFLSGTSDDNRVHARVRALSQAFDGQLRVWGDPVTVAWALNLSPSLKQISKAEVDAASIVWILSPDDFLVTPAIVERQDVPDVRSAPVRLVAPETYSGWPFSAGDMFPASMISDLLSKRSSVLRRLLRQRQERAPVSEIVALRKSATPYELSVDAVMMMEERMLEVSPLPQYIQVEVASACNLRCDMCFYHSDRLKDGTLHVKKGDFLDDALIDKVIDEMAAFTDGHCFSKPQFYASTRGEFFLYPKAVELIHKVTSRGIGFYVVTNGTLMNDDAAKALVDCQADQVTVSLDSLTEETGSDIRVGYSQETVEANIDNLVVYRAKSGQKKPFISLCFTDVGRNSHEIDGYIKKWKDKVDQIFVQNEAAFDEQRGARYWTRKRWDLPVEKRDVCLALVNSVAIMADGTVHACTGGDYKDDTVLGHIENDTIAACFRSARKDTLMAAHLNRDFQNLHVCGVCEKWKTYQSRFLKYEGDWSMSRDSIATLVLQPNKKSA